MSVLLTGATGLLGRALTLTLRCDGHHVIAWVRSRESRSCPVGRSAGARFLPQLCADWEATARRAEESGLRVVLGLDGSMLCSLQR